MDIKVSETQLINVTVKIRPKELHFGGQKLMSYLIVKYETRHTVNNVRGLII